MIPGSERSAGEGIGYPFQYSWASLMVQLVKNPPAMQETWVQSLGGKIPWRSSSIYSLQYSGLENSMDCIVYGVAKSQIQLSNFHLCCIAQQLKAFAMPYCISESHSVVSDWRGGGWDDLGEWH